MGKYEVCVLNRLSKVFTYPNIEHFGAGQRGSDNRIAVAGL